MKISYSTVLNKINSWLKTNGNREITAMQLKEILLDIIGNSEELQLKSGVSVDYIHNAGTFTGDKTRTLLTWQAIANLLGGTGTGSVRPWAVGPFDYHVVDDFNIGEVASGVELPGGYLPVAGEKLMLMNQSNPVENGLYVVGELPGDTVRDELFPTAESLAGVLVSYTDGTIKSISASPDGNIQSAPLETLGYTAENIMMKGASNGYAPLDADARMWEDNLPLALLQQISANAEDVIDLQFAYTNELVLKTCKINGKELNADITLNLTGNEFAHQGEALNTVLHANPNGVLSFSKVVEDDMNVHDVNTNNTSSFAHGFCPKLSGSATEFLSGAGTWLTPSTSPLSIPKRYYAYSKQIDLKQAANTLVTLFTTEANKGRFVCIRATIHADSIASLGTYAPIFNIGWSDANYYDFVATQQMPNSGWTDTQYNDITLRSNGTSRRSAAAASDVKLKITQASTATTYIATITIEGYYTNDI